MPAYFDMGFSVRQPMWHGQGNVLEDYPDNWDEARLAAGLLWEPKLVPLFQEVPQGATVPALPQHLQEAAEDLNAEEALAEPQGATTEDGRTFAPVGSHRLVVRDDTEAVLGVVSSGYRLVSHGTMGEIMEAILGQPNMLLETAGSCRGGAQVWALARLDEPVEVAGDDTPTYPYVALLNSHDGTGACKAVATDVRVVCWNTYQAASMQGQRTGRQFVFRHTAGVLDRIEDAKAAIRGVREEHVAWVELATELAALRVREPEFVAFLDGFLPDPVAEAGQIVSERVKANVAANRATFRKVYEESPTTDAHRGTALGLVHTAVEYLDHLRTYRNPDTYLGRTLLRPEPLKAGAVALAREVCASSN